MTAQHSLRAPQEAESMPTTSRRVRERERGREGERDSSAELERKLHADQQCRLTKCCACGSACECCMDTPFVTGEKTFGNLDIVAREIQSCPLASVFFEPLLAQCFGLFDVALSSRCCAEWKHSSGWWRERTNLGT